MEDTIYSDADLEMREMAADAASIDYARTHGSEDFDPTNAHHMSVLRGAYDSAWYACASTYAACSEALADYGIRTNDAFDNAYFDYASKVNNN